MKILLISLMLLSTCLYAETTEENTEYEEVYWPVGAGIIPPIQLPLRKTAVKGIRLGLPWANHNKVRGLSISLLGNQSRDMAGVEIGGIFNKTRVTKIYGFQLAGLFNINSSQTKIYGIQAALFSNKTGPGHVTGIQAALVGNFSHKTNVNGLQVGLINFARTVRGVQIGMANVAKNLYGIQIGIINVNHSGYLKFMPLINAGF